MRSCYFIIGLIFMLGNANSQQPPKWQAIDECKQARQLAKQIAEAKNEGVTKRSIHLINSVASDGRGIMGDLALVFFDMHTKGASPSNFEARMYQRCMRSNGY